MKSTHTETSHDIALLMLRAITGTVFAFHGTQKLFGGLDGFAGYLGSIGVPLPHLNATLAAGAEFFGGLALLAGIRVSWAAAPLVFTMLVACFALRKGGFDSQNGGMEYPLTLGIVTAAIGLLGAGRFTVAALLSKLRAVSERSDLSQRDPDVANLETK